MQKVLYKTQNACVGGGAVAARINAWTELAGQYPTAATAWVGHRRRAPPNELNE